MKKITIRKTDQLIFDGKRISTGHWTIALDIFTSNFILNEPYQFLVENGIQFKKEFDGRPILQNSLPDISSIMNEGDIPCEITNISINGNRIVSWNNEGEAGTVAFKPEYINLVEDLGSYYTLNGKHDGMLSACDGERVIAVIMPLRCDKTEKENSIRPVWNALQLELEPPESKNGEAK